MKLFENKNSKPNVNWRYFEPKSKELSTFQKVVVSPSSGSSNLGLHDPEGDTLKKIRKARNYLSVNTALHHTALASWTAEGTCVRIFLASGFCFTDKNCAQTVNRKLQCQPEESVTRGTVVKSL